jgi:Malectin domain
MSLSRFPFALLPALAVLLLVPATTQPARAADDAKADDAKAAGEAVDEVAHDGTIRIKAGSAEKFKDHDGNVWNADKGEASGFKGGETIARAPDLAIENTEDPDLYRSERYSMESFTKDLPNGKYTVKLHFAETFEEITAEGQRVFTFKVGDKEFKDFDVFKKAGGAKKAYIETVETEVKDGKLVITFTAQTQNPQINAIEIKPAS